MPNWVYQLAGSGIVGLMVAYVCGYLALYSQRQRHLQDRLEKIIGRKNADENWTEKSKTASVRTHLSRLEKNLNDILKSSSSKFRNLRLILYRSGFQRKPDLFLVLFTTIYLVSSFIFIVIIELSLLKGILLCTLITTCILMVILKIRAKKWESQFSLQFPQALDIMTRSLKAGLTLGRGIAVVAQESPRPISTEFQYLAAQLQIGSSAENALAEAADRIGLEDFRFFTTALLIQREMGGSLSEILRKLADVIRGREKFRKKVTTLSAESRTTGIIISALPFLALLGIEVIRPGNIQFFILDPVGKFLGLLIVTLTVTGFIVMRKMIQVPS